MASQEPHPQWNAEPRKSNVNWGLLLLIVGGIVVVGYIVSEQQAASGPSNGGNGGGGQHQAPVTISGSGIETSRKFHLNGGDYLVRWTATPDTDHGCYHGATLESTDVSVFETLASELLDDGTPKSGSTYLYQVEDANYYVDASSGCDWSFTFTQQ